MSKKEEVEFTPNQVHFFRLYKYDRPKVELFRRLRVNKDVLLSDERLCWAICAKKTYEKALKMALAYQKLLEEYGVDEMKIDEKLFAHPSGAFKKMVLMESFFYGLHGSSSRENYGIFYMDYGRWEPLKGKVEAKLCLAIWMILFEKLMRKRPENVTEGIIYVCDFGDFGWKNFDFNIEKLAANVFKNMPCRYFYSLLFVHLTYNRTRMKYFVMFDTPWYINAIMKLIKPFYSNKMMKRMIICKKADLSKYIVDENLIEQFGGKERFDYKDWYEAEFPGLKFKGKPKFFSRLPRPQEPQVVENNENENENEVEVEEEVEGEDET